MVASGELQSGYEAFVVESYFSSADKKYGDITSSQVRVGSIPASAREKIIDRTSVYKEVLGIDFDTPQDARNLIDSYNKPLRDAGLFGATKNYANVEMSQVVASLMSIPEYKSLYDQAVAALPVGQLSITFGGTVTLTNETTPHYASINLDTGVINVRADQINMNSYRAVVFETMNAVQFADFQEIAMAAKAGHILADEFTEISERYEYKSAVVQAELAMKYENIFGPTTGMNVVRNGQIVGWDEFRPTIKESHINKIKEQFDNIVAGRVETEKYGLLTMDLSLNQRLALAKNFATMGSAAESLERANIIGWGNLTEEQKSQLQQQGIYGGIAEYGAWLGPTSETEETATNENE
jgi:hypothetical protein